MSPRSAEPAGAPRIAIVGAPTVGGTHVREALAAHGVPGRRVDLYGVQRGEVLLSEYAGEARMVQEPELDEVARHALIFLCETGEVAGRLPAAAAESVIIDLEGCLPESLRPRRLALDDPAPELRAGDRLFAVPHSLALVLAETLAPVERALGLAEVVAVVLRPAADFGPAGVEELREQTVRLLNFLRVPVETFGRQLAFNVIPDERVAAAGGGLAARLEREVAELLGQRERRITVRLLAAPIFHGHALLLRLRLARATHVAELREVLAQADLWAAPGAVTPLDVIGEERVALSELSEDGLDGFWLWGVIGETGARGARQAVRLAARLFEF